MPNLGPLIRNSSHVKNAILGTVVKAGTEPDRMPVWRTPAHYGMEFKDVSIVASDGIRLSAWEIIRPDTKKLAVVNHPLMCNRYGSSKGVDDVPVEFIPMLRHLYVAGYSIISYDQRGQGESDGNIGAKLRGPTECVGGSGAEEWKDVIGVMNYVKANWPEHEVALVGQCMGANSMFKCFTEQSTAFDGVNVKCFTALQPTRSTEMRGRMTQIKLGMDIAEDAGKLQMELHGFAGVDCVANAPDVKFPTLVAGMKADVYAGDDKGHDIQQIFDALTTEKKLLWFGPGTDKPFGKGLRFEGYGYYNYHPEELIDFLNTYTGGPSLPPPGGVPTSPAFGGLQPKEGVTACQQCGAAFGMTSWAHRCRKCGRVLCKHCSPKKVGGERACIPCWAHAEVDEMDRGCAEVLETKIATSVDIDAPASVVWSLFQDGMNIHTWSSSMQTLEGDLREGGQVTINFKFMGLDFAVPHTVQNFEDGIQWSWSDEIDHGIRNNHLYRVEAVDGTHSRFINNDELTGGNQVIRYGILRDMTVSYDQFNEQVKAEAEKRFAAAA